MEESKSLLLHYLCLDCGCEYGNASLACGKCESCGMTLSISTESALARTFDDAPGSVRHRIIEAIEQRYWRLRVRCFFTVIPRVLHLEDEKFIPYFCLRCGALLWETAVGGGGCRSCGAASTVMNEEQFQAKFNGAPEAVKAKIITGIMKHRVLLMLFHARTVVSSWVKFLA